MRRVYAWEYVSYRHNRFSRRINPGNYETNPHT
jgi:hypothetical protein